MTSNLQKEFDEKGYIFIKNFFSKEEIITLIDEIKHTSAEHATEDILNVGALKFNSLIMHKSLKLREFISQPKVVNFLTQFMGPNIWARWDQAVEKGPGAGTFPWHQDNSYSRLKDPHYQLWISLTKMTKDNGGIWIIPGSHKKNLLHGSDGTHNIFEGNTDNAEFISAEIGDIVLFSSRALHSTTPNITKESRWAYVVEYMKMQHIDPYIDKPHLIIAEHNKPSLRYVQTLASERDLINIIKYLNIKENLRIIKRKYFPKTNSV